MGMNAPGWRFRSSGVIKALLFLMLFIVSMTGAGWACTSSWIADGPLFVPVLVYMVMCLVLVIVQWIGKRKIWFPVVGVLVLVVMFVVSAFIDEVWLGFFWLAGVVLLSLLNVAAVWVHDSPVIRWSSGIAALGSFGVLLVFLISALTLMPATNGDVFRRWQDMLSTNRSIQEHSRELIAIGVVFISALLTLYGLIHLINVFIKRVVRRGECRVSKVVVGFSVLSFLILLIMLVPNHMRANVVTHFYICQNNCKKIGDALEMYSTVHGGKYPESLCELTPDYIKEIPKCPHEKLIMSIGNFPIYYQQKPKDTYSPLYQAYNDPTGKHCRYTFCCAGENHRIIIQGNYPRYDSEHGLVNGRN